MNPVTGHAPISRNANPDTKLMPPRIIITRLSPRRESDRGGSSTASR
jgi:hypothetical protein